jgi:uncharacterized protein YndB with AHSA1/START domain
MIDVVEQVNAVRRQVGSRTIEAGEARPVTISQTYPAAVEDVWDAVTNQERIPRWFSPVSGELKLGGRYPGSGTAGGTVEHCDPPKSFAVTWEFNGEVSWVEVRLTADGDELIYSILLNNHLGAKPSDIEDQIVVRLAEHSADGESPMGTFSVPEPSDEMPDDLECSWTKAC